MHQVSRRTTQLAQKHALQSLEQGKSMEEVGKRLQTSNLLEEEIGQSLEEFGKAIQDKAEVFWGRTQKLAEDSSLEVFLDCLQAHIDANNSHIEAVNALLVEAQKHHDKIKDKLPQVIRL